MSMARPPNLDDWYTRQGLTVKGGGITLQAGGAIKGGQTTYNTGTGFFLGYHSGAYKFSLGNPSANYLTFDGTNLAIGGALSLTLTGNGITLSSGGYVRGGQTDYATGTGFFLGYSGAAYKFSIGSTTSYLRWDGSALSIIGDITGAANIDITGRAEFTGTSSGPLTDSAVYIDGLLTVDGPNGSSGISVSVGGTASSRGMYIQSTGPGSLHGLVFDMQNTGYAIDVGTNCTNGINLRTSVLSWNSYNYAVPPGTGTKFLRDDGNWSLPPVTLAGSETLTNKTLTSPVINGFSGTGDGTVTGKLTVTSLVTNTYTVANLPAAGSNTGVRVGVSDADTPVFAAVVVGGGTTACPVYSDGTNWRCG